VVLMADVMQAALLTSIAFFILAFIRMTLKANTAKKAYTSGYVYHNAPTITFIPISALAVPPAPAFPGTERGPNSPGRAHQQLPTAGSPPAATCHIATPSKAGPISSSLQVHPTSSSVEPASAAAATLSSIESTVLPPALVPLANGPTPPAHVPTQTPAAAAPVGQWHAGELPGSEMAAAATPPPPPQQRGEWSLQALVLRLRQRTNSAATCDTHPVRTNAANQGSGNTRPGTAARPWAQVPGGQGEAHWWGVATLPGVQVEELDGVEEAGHVNGQATQPVAKWGAGVVVVRLKGLVVNVWQWICEDDAFQCVPTHPCM
jgi:hypothetical protein